uniref:Vesicle transport protein n=1 Tax=Globisporangium ultimum (strain ATCC 200006 / CBS 805.95 / DAOM BR144) TaxID=431595 RepID=K3W6I1_GLOUD
MSSAWEQWGAKRPANGGAQDAFQSLLRSSPLAATVSSSGENGAYSLQKMWDSARDLTKNAVSGIVVAGSPANSTVSTVGSATDLEALESGQMRASGGDTSAEDVESATATWPFFRRKSNTENALLPTMSWNTRFKYFVGMTLMGLMFFGMASIFLPLIMIRPSKFALSFTFGSLCLMGALAMLKGPAAYAASLLEPKRLLLTTAYFLTLAFGMVFMKAARGMLQTFARLFR